MGLSDMVRKMVMARASLFVAGVVLLTLSGMAACRPSETTAPGRLPVIGTFYPFFEAAAQVGGTNASVRNLTPPGTEPHDYEPTPRDVVSLNQARIVVFDGAGFEPWLGRVIPDLQSQGAVLVDASQHVDLIQMTEGGTRLPDPHFWLDPVLMQRIVLAVRDAYVQVDPGKQSVYTENAGRYVAELQALDEKYRQGLLNAPLRTIVTSHAAFAYLARRYGLEVINIAGLDPEQEPSPQQLAAITRMVRAQGIKYIFFETLVSPRLAETIARETGAQTLVLNPVEGLTEAEIKQGKNYISVMEDNLTNLKLALGVGR